MSVDNNAPLLAKDDPNANLTDETVFNAVVEQTRPMVYGRLLWMLKNREDAEDATQSTFLNAHRSAKTFRHGSKPYSWITRIAINEGKMILRKNNPTFISIGEKMPRDIPSSAPGQDDLLYTAQRSSMLRDAIEQLPPILRRPVILIDMQEHSVEETAKISGVGIPAMKSRIKRARAMLREIISRQLAGGKEATVPLDDVKPIFRAAATSVTRNELILAGMRETALTPSSSHLSPGP